ncbi:MAG: methionine--tRNA ligase [Actinobacteria bacterium]|nr:methionine--tRNA ligase [Actinomycetota bacterium]
MPFYVTTPIYYVNATPHVGNAYTTIAADILTRHRRQRGEDAFFLTGTDEHGSNIARVAAEAGLEPKELADRNAAVFREMAERLDVQNDFFIRTTDPEHEAVVQEFVQRIHDNGHIYEGVYAGLYCPRCEAFYAEDELVEGLCPQHAIPPERVEEKNYFFRLSAFADQVLALYEENDDYVLPRFRANEARSFIERGLDDISVSRAGQTWGVAVPWDPEQVIYVWVDALINYYSALTYARPGEDLRPRYWTEVRHLLAKDILKFHCVIWPALLLAAGESPPKQLFVHGYLLVDDRKMSKSRGNVIDPLAVAETYGNDALRYYLFRAVSFGQDGSISLDGLHERYERELANDLGNLLSRTTAMIARYRGGRLAVVEEETPWSPEELGRSVAARLDRFDLTGALEEIWELVRTLNRFVETEAPWRLAKDESRARDLDLVLYRLADGLSTLAVALGAFLPETAPRILAALGQPPDLSWERLRAGAAVEAEGIEAAEPLFPRVELPTAA